MYVGRFVGIAVLSVLLSSTASQAQDAAHWGVSASYTPSWTDGDRFPKLREPLWGINQDTMSTLQGSEFTVGIVRGSVRGGDWGVSFVHKPFDDGSQLVEVDVSEPCTPLDCTRSTRTVVLQNARLQGVEFHWAPSFVTIADRMQVGMNVAGGIATVKGDAIDTLLFEQTFTVPGFGTQTGAFGDTLTGSLKDLEVLYSAVPLLKLEAQGSVILAPGLKLRVSGGLNMPTLSIRVGAVYLFGAR
jgi:hypothetical protein